VPVYFYKRTRQTFTSRLSVCLAVTVLVTVPVTVSGSDSASDSDSGSDSALAGTGRPTSQLSVTQPSQVTFTFMAAVLGTLSK